MSEFVSRDNFQDELLKAFGQSPKQAPARQGYNEVFSTSRSGAFDARDFVNDVREVFLKHNISVEKFPKIKQSLGVIFEELKNA